MGLELPEIATISNHMKFVLNEAQIINVKLKKKFNAIYGQEFYNLEEAYSRIVYQKIVNIRHQGKWIFVEFENSECLILGEIDGKILYHDSLNNIPETYDVLFTFNNGKYLSVTYKNIYIGIYRKVDLENNTNISRIGLSIDHPDFDLNYFRNVIERNSNERIIDILGNQSELAGLGHLYINEILNRSTINPLLKGGDLSQVKIDTLYYSIFSIIHSAIDFGNNIIKVDLSNKGKNLYAV